MKSGLINIKKGIPAVIQNIFSKYVQKHSPLASIVRIAIQAHKGVEP